MKLIQIYLLTVVLSFTTFSQNKDIAPEIYTLLLAEMEIQKMNVKQVYFGSQYYSNVKDEIQVSKFFNTIPEKIEKLNYISNKMENINALTSKIIKEIDLVKYKILNENNENLVVIETKTGGFPDFFDLYFMNFPTKTISWNENKTLIGKINSFRDEIVLNCANYKFSKEYNLDLKPNDNFLPKEDFQNFIRSTFDSRTYNYMEDRQVLIDLYSIIYKSASRLINLDNSSIVNILSVLTIIQKDVLEARTLAMVHWVAKVSTGQLNIDKIVPIVDGPNKISVGSTYEYKVFMGALNTSEKPEIKITSHKNASIKYNNDGSYTVIFSPETTGKIELEGTISIKNKMGDTKVENWHKTIEVN